MAAFDIEFSNPFPSGYDAWYGGPGDGGHSGSEWFHSFGMDLGAPGGTPVHAVFDGHVTRLNLQNINKTQPPHYGAEIFVRSHNNLMGCFYTHVKDLAPGLAVGANLTRGDVIGHVVGSASSPHLHLAIVEIIGGPSDGNYKGVNLSQWFRDTANSSASGVVAFHQDGRAPTVFGSDGGTLGFDLSTISGFKEALALLGYYTGSIDDVDDNETKEAVRAFQSDYELEIDGEVGPLTRAALQLAIDLL